MFLCCPGSLEVSELETTVRRLDLEASVTVVQGETLEAMEETVALAEVGKLHFVSLLSVVCCI